MKSLFIFGALFCSLSLFSQNIGINTTGANPDASAMLDVVSSDKGLLIPRVNIIDLATAAPITAPTTSLLVYNTNAASGVGYYYWDGSKWNRLYDETVNSADHDWYEVGGTNSPNAILDDIFTNGKVGVGINVPTAKLEISEAFNGDVSVLKLRNTVGSGSIRTGVAIDFHHFSGGSVGSQILSQQNGLSGYDANLIFSTEEGDAVSSGLQERMRITYDGDVGIGTTDIRAKLHVNNGNNSYGTILANADEYSFSLYAKTLNTQPANIESFRLGLKHGVNENNGFVSFYRGPGTGGGWISLASNGLERLTIRPNGDVGVGDPLPTSKLDVNGDLRVRTIASGTSSNDFLVADANGVVKSAPLVTNVTDGGANLRMYTGHTPSDGTGWSVYNANGIYIDIDISACGFSSPPQIFTNMGGGSGSWTTSGASSTYAVTATSFRVYINAFTDVENNATITPADADSRNWYINWFAVGN